MEIVLKVLEVQVNDKSIIVGIAFLLNLLAQKSTHNPLHTDFQVHSNTLNEKASEEGIIFELLKKVSNDLIN
jgi:hypothetical protein